MSQLALTTLSGVGLFSTLGFVISAYKFFTSVNNKDETEAFFSLLYLPVYGVVGGMTGLAYGLYMKMFGVIGGYLNRDKGGYMNGLGTATGFFIGAFCGTCLASFWNMGWSLVGYTPALTFVVNH